MASIPVVRADDAIGSLVAALRRSDELTAHAVDVLADLMPSGGIERVSGLPAELLVSLEAGRPAWEARALCEAASSLRAMPRLRAVFGRGEVSWALVRSVVAAVRRLDVEARARIDAVIADLVAAEAEPEVVLERVDDLVASMRADLSVATADRRIEAGFVSLQPFVDGSGGSVFRAG